MELVKTLFPGCTSYTDVYLKHNLLTDRVSEWHSVIVIVLYIKDLMKYFFAYIFYISFYLIYYCIYILFYIDTFVTDSFCNFVDCMFWIESKCESLKSMHDINKCQSSIQWLLENCFTLRYYASVMGCMKLLLRFFFFFLKGAVIFQTPLPFKINK